MLATEEQQEEVLPAQLDPSLSPRVASDERRDCVTVYPSLYSIYSSVNTVPFHGKVTFTICD